MKRNTALLSNFYFGESKSRKFNTSSEKRLILFQSIPLKKSIIDFMTEKEAEKRTSKLGLKLKGEPNSLQDYIALHRSYVRQYRQPDELTMIMEQWNATFKSVCQAKLEEIKAHPDYYFNFDLNYPDFKAFLIKLLYSRAVRTMIDRNRVKEAKKDKQMRQTEMKMFLQQEEIRKHFKK